MEISEIETPALLVDADRLEKNLSYMRDWLKGKKIDLRPHFKTPKTPLIAWKEIENGAIGVCAQKLGEVEVLVGAGIKDIFLTNEVVEPTKIRRLVNLAKHSKIRVLVDNPIHVRAVSNAAVDANAKIEVLIDVEMGMMRCGVPPGKPAVELAQAIVKSPNLSFKGIHVYAGNLQQADQTIGMEKKLAECEKVDKTTIETRDGIKDGGIDVETVTGAGTGSYRYQYQSLTEIQTGSYVFMDHKYKISAPEFENALSILTTVNSTPEEDRVIVDAGLKSLSTDAGPAIVKDAQGVEYKFGGDEHGILRGKGVAKRFPLGKKLELYPSHCDTTVNLYDKFYLVRKGEVDSIWDILARGKVQ